MNEKEIILETEEYAVSMKLSDETVSKLEMPMIPKEEYIHHVNGL